MNSTGSAEPIAESDGSRCCWEARKPADGGTPRFPAVVGDLAVGLAHEIRNPLTSIKLLVQNAAQRAAAPCLTERHLDVIQEEIARIENTVQGLMDLARPPRLRSVVLDLRDIVERAIEAVEVQAESERRVAVEPFPASPVLVQGDAKRLQQAFVNLLLDGLRGAGSAGAVHVTIEAAEPLVPVCRVLFSQPYRVVPQHLIDSIFDPFMCYSQRGVGLALAISRSIVEQHGGTLIAANRPRGGLVCTVELPDAQTPHRG